ncbi:MAG: hypothetical protein L6416_00135, partial [Candidatus Omnitrophica bacterium]|nr:hypothetical protein [Candidatus Omnitrophota bacterium]
MKQQIFTKITVIFAGYLFCSSIIYAQEQDTLTPNPQDKEYVGIEKCKTCHTKEYTIFQERKFDKTWKALVMRGETENPSC